ncbi:MAG: DUF4832 domain-containing protein [Clostridia bacterium]|nr:DUF4832 domain-containing protein [Clostridia bacterium]
MKRETTSDKRILCYLSALIAAMIAVIIIIAAPLSCVGSKTGESIEKINNPDQGFYRPIYVEVTESGAKYNANIINDNTQLYHLRADISAFSKAVNGIEDKELTASALDGIEELLQTLRSRGKNAVVRFAYDPKYNGAKDKEPSLDMICTHISQISGVLNRYPATITAVEVGLIGPWGEMHSSAISKLDTKATLAKKYLDETADSGLAILVRTPDVIYNCLNKTINDIDGYVIPKESLYYRLGLFNDGYLGSGNDLGTYNNRAREVKFMSVQNGHLPYGGEVVTSGNPSDDKWRDIKNCTPEMYEMGLSYLNIEWNNNEIAKWQKTYYTQDCGYDRLYYGSTAFDYIQNHMGYRLVLKSSKLKSKRGTVKVSLKIKNVGFGNMLKEKKVRLIFVNGDDVREVDCGTYKGGNLNFSAQCGFKGKYAVYLCLYGEEFDDGKPNYTVQFANKNVWNDEFKANFIGNIKIK